MPKLARVQPKAFFGLLHNAGAASPRSDDKLSTRAEIAMIRVLDPHEIVQDR